MLICSLKPELISNYHNYNLMVILVAIATTRISNTRYIIIPDNLIFSSNKP